MKSEKQYYLGAEWERHSATQLHWPVGSENWSSYGLEQVEEMYCKIIEELHFFEVIHLFVPNLMARNRVMNKLSLKAVDLDRVVIHQVAINDIWARDCGPIFVKDENGESCIMNWKYNAWGEKYSPWSDDDEIPKYVANKYGIRCIEPAITLEGGSIEVNGVGILLTTESALLNKNRNPGISKEELTHKLERYLGIKEIIWLKGGLSTDGRDGQVQNVTRWLNRYTVLTMVIADRSHPDHDILRENLEVLKSTKLNNGQKLKVKIFELPEDITVGNKNDEMPLTYMGFYIANGCVFVPQFKIEKKDRDAVSLMEHHFPGRKVIPIDCTSLIERSCSGIHGISQPWKGITY